MQKKERITMDMREFCDLVGISNTTGYSLVREGQVPHIRVRGKILFNREVIESWTKGDATGRT